MLLGLRTAIYPAADLAQATEWYGRVLDLKPYFHEPYYVGFKVGGFELGLVPDGTPGVDGPQPLWGVADAEVVHQRLIELGARPLEAVMDVGGGMKIGAVIDPFGNRLGFIALQTSRRALRPQRNAAATATTAATAPAAGSARSSAEYRR